MTDKPKDEGQVRGAVLLTDAEYVIRCSSWDTLFRVQDETARMGYELDYNSIKPMEWYPIRLRYISLLAIKKVMQMDDDQFRAMGASAPKYSLLTRLMLRHLMNLDSVARNIQKYWNKNYDVGIIKAVNEKDKFYICIKDCPVPRQVFPYMEGYFSSVLALVVGSGKSIRIQEFRWKHITGDCLEFALNFK